MGSSSLESLMAKRLEGKVAIISGGASGIGAATARVFVKHGAKVTIADIQDDLGTSLVQDIGEENATFVHCNVAIESDVENVVDVTVAKFGKLDIMFSNAGIFKQMSSILEVDYDIIKKVFDVNVVGAFFCAKHAARVMIPAKRGAIIFTASIVSVIYASAIPHTYSASKSAVVGLSKNLGVELGAYGIRVNCVSPYFISTPMALNVDGMVDKQVMDQLFYKAGNLKGALLDEEDIANAVLYLASDDSKYVSGMNLTVDGGFSTTNVALTETYNKSFPSTSI